MPTMSRRWVGTGLVVGVIAVSISAILARVAMGDEPGVASAAPGDASALAVAFWRTAAGAAILAPLGWRAARQHRIRTGSSAMTPRRHRALALSGLALGAHFALFQGSLALTTVASAVTLATMSPIFVALGGWWLLKEPSDRRTLVGMAITIVGAVTIGWADVTAADHGPDALLGDVMAFLSALAVTAYLLIGRIARRDVPALTYSALVFAWAAAPLLVLCLLSGAPLLGFDPSVWLAIAGIVVGPQLLGHTVFNALLAAVPATTVSIVVLSEPVGAGILAWLLLGELPAPLFALGAPLVLAGVAIATARRRPPLPAHELAATER
ncbi:MAG: DMT family transporter [Nitriliruptoraceae bacterium]|nr:DMT family transporter [Nitriliruptoraceae bacterium]